MTKKEIYFDLNDAQFTTKKPSVFFMDLMNACTALKKNLRTDHGRVSDCIVEFFENCDSYKLSWKKLTVKDWWELFTKEYPHFALYLTLDTYFLSESDRSAFNNLIRVVNKKNGLPEFVL